MTPPHRAAPALPAFMAHEGGGAGATAPLRVLPVPYEATTTYRPGCRGGPEALLAASDELEAYDLELEREVSWELGIHTCAPVADTRATAMAPADAMPAIREAGAQLAATVAFGVTVGGEHSVTAGLLQGYRQYWREPFTVVQIDAHADLRDRYEGSPHNHACVMRRVQELGLPILPVGIRSLCREEAQRIARQQLPVVWARDAAAGTGWIERALASIETERVFITIDLDGLDPGLMPGVGTPEPGGLAWYPLLHFLRRTFERHTVIGSDIMELAPVADSVVSQFSAAKLAYKLLGYGAWQRGW